MPSLFSRLAFSKSTHPLRSSDFISTLTAKSRPLSSKAKHINLNQVSKFSQWKTKWVTDWWAVELICWIIAALSLVGVVITLESHKNKPLPKWHFNITINSLISILATTGQMAMMKPVIECISQLKWLWFLRRKRILGIQVFDDASRGPTGSLALLGKLGGLHLVSLGAAITVVAVAFGPFAQQVVTYPLILTPTGIATIPQVFFYNITLATGAVNRVIAAALSEGLIQTNANLSTVTPFCSTGNCTWPQYSSLGVCANVEDISSTIINNDCNTTSFEEIFKIAGVTNPGYPCFNYSLPDIGFAGSLQSTDNITLSNGDPTESFEEEIGFMQVLALTSALNNASSLYTIYLMYQPDLLTSINSSLSSPEAYRLNLDLCVQTYNSTTSNGITNTTMLSSQFLPINLTQTLNSKKQTILSGSSVNSVSIGNDTFGITQKGIISITASMETLFFDSCFETIPGGPIDPNFIQQGEGIACLFETGEPFVNVVSNSTNRLLAVTEKAKILAISLTNVFRTGAGGDTQVVAFNGTAFTPLVFVEANYLWLLLPIGLVCLTLVFLLATILKSQRLGSRIWKSSNLATLQGIHVDLHTKLGGLSSISEMEEKVKSLEVRFDIKGGVKQQGVEYSLVESMQEKHWKG